MATMRIPGVIRSIYWRRQLRQCRVAPWKQLPLGGEDRRPSVAIVGNAGYLCDLALGEQIDAHDIVVRMNNFQTEGFERSVGCKLDLYAVNFVEEIHFDNPKIREARWIAATVPCNFTKDRDHGMPFRHGIHIARGLELMGRDDVYVPSEAYISGLYGKLGAVPTTGAMAILLITETLGEQVGDVFITGFSFFEGRSHYYSDKTVVPERHDPGGEKTMLAEHLREHMAAGRVTLDPVMAQHLK